MTVQWDSASDWDNAASESGVAHEDVRESSTPTELYKDTDGLLTGTFREKLWTIRRTADDWLGFVTYDDGSGYEKLGLWESSDGVSWTANANNPVIDEGFAVQDVSVVQDSGGTWYAYLENTGNGADALRVYTSDDGVSWTYQTNISNAYNPQSPVCIIQDGTFYLFYEQFASTPWTVRYATSTDGVNFTDQAEVLSGNDGEGDGPVPDNILNDGGTWYMWVHIAGRTGLNDPYYATSSTLTGTYTLQDPLTPNNTEAESTCAVHALDGTWAGRLGSSNDEVWAYLWDTSDDDIDFFKSTAVYTSHTDASILQQGHSYSSPPLAADLLFYYPFDETDSGNVYDVSGNGNHGSNSGSARGATGLLGTNAFDMAGADYVSSGQSQIGSPVSAVVWVKPSAMDNNDHFIGNVADSNSGSGNYTGWGLRTAYSGTLVPEVIWGDGAAWQTLSGSTAIPTGEWTMLAFTHDGTTGELYRDGGSVASASHGLSASSETVWIGDTANYGNGVAGAFDLAATWTAGLAPADVQEMYDAVKTDGSLITAGKVL